MGVILFLFLALRKPFCTARTTIFQVVENIAEGEARRRRRLRTPLLPPTPTAYLLAFLCPGAARGAGGAAREWTPGGAV